MQSDPLLSAHPQLWNAAQSADADRHTMETLGVGSPVLMERASLCVAAQAEALLAGESLPVWILVGPGNNGGDGLAVARILAHRGHDVRAVLATSKRNDAATEQLALAKAFSVPVDNAPSGVPPHRALVLDALLGTGSTGAPRAGIETALQWQRGITGPRLAVDVPTGVEVDTGIVHDGAFEADVTVTFQCSKVGLHVTPGRHCAGRVVVADIGIRAEAPTAPAAMLIDPERIAATLEALSPGRHKSDRGHVAVIGGARGTPGAAILSGLAALRTGAGLVTIVTTSADVRAQIIGQRPEVMVSDWSADEDPHPGADALVVGPGLTDPEGLDRLCALYVGDPRPALWDASGLAEIPVDSPPSGPRIITPHPGEAAKMLARATGQSWSSSDVQARRLEAARVLADRFGATVVLKGEGTIVTAPTRGVAICAAGGSALATAGTGDCLSGLGGALLARGLDAWQAARAAAHVHALAGDRALAHHAFPTALDVVEALSEVLRPPVLRAKVHPWPSLCRG